PFSCLQSKACWPQGQHAWYVRLGLVDQAIFCRRRRAKVISPPQARTRPGRPAPTSGAGTGTEPAGATGPAWPVGPLRVAGTKVNPRLFAPVRAATVALATWKERTVPMGKALAPPFPHMPVSQVIPKAKFPVPSPVKDPVSAIKCVPAAV